MISSEPVKKLLRYLIAGSIGAATQVGFLYLFTDLIGFWYLTSAILAFFISITVSFILQKWWTFRHRDASAVPTQAGLYIVNALINLGLNTFFLYILVDHIHLNHLIAQIITSAVVAVLSFFVYNHLIFHHGNPIDNHPLL